MAVPGRRGWLPQAQYALAEAYSFGNIVPLDQDQNRLWLEKAAASGHRTPSPSSMTAANPGTCAPRTGARAN